MPSKQIAEESTLKEEEVNETTPGEATVPTAEHQEEDKGNGKQPSIVTTSKPPSGRTSKSSLSSKSKESLRAKLPSSLKPEELKTQSLVELSVPAASQSGGAPYHSYTAALFGKLEGRVSSERHIGRDTVEQGPLFQKPGSSKLDDNSEDKSDLTTRQQEDSTNEEDPAQKTQLVEKEPAISEQIEKTSNKEMTNKDDEKEVEQTGGDGGTEVATAAVTTQETPEIEETDEKTEDVTQDSEKGVGTVDDSSQQELQQSDKQECNTQEPEKEKSGNNNEKATAVVAGKEESVQVTVAEEERESDLSGTTGGDSKQETGEEKPDNASVEGSKEKTESEPENNGDNKDELFSGTNQNELGEGKETKEEEEEKTAVEKKSNSEGSEEVTTATCSTNSSEETQKQILDKEMEKKKEELVHQDKEDDKAKTEETVTVPETKKEVESTDCSSDLQKKQPEGSSASHTSLASSKTSLRTSRMKLTGSRKSLQSVKDIDKKTGQSSHSDLTET